MKNQTFETKIDKLIFEMDQVDKLIYVYYIGINSANKNVLRTINSDMAKKIENYFSINLKEYSVLIDGTEAEETNANIKEIEQTLKRNKFILIISLLIYGSQWMIDSLGYMQYEPLYPFITIMTILVALAFTLVATLQTGDLAAEKVFAKHNIRKRPARSGKD